MKFIRNLFALLGALTFLGIVAIAILFFYAPTILQQVDKLEEADAIVVLGGQYFRPIYAAELYAAGYAPLVLVSKPIVYNEITALRDLGIKRQYQWEVFRDVLLTKGVPKDKIFFFGEENMSTVDEAENLKLMLGTKKSDANIKKIILVTSPLHTARAGKIFRDTLPNIDFIVVATPYDPVPEKWWSNFRTAPFIVLEAAKNIYYYFGGAFRNSEQQP